MRRPRPGSGKEVRVAVLAQHALPETFSGANRVSSLATVLGRPFDVTLYAPLPSYPDPRAFAVGDAGAVDAASPFATVRVKPAARSGKLVGRALHELALCGRLGRTASRTGADVVVASSPSMFLGPIGLALARVSGARFVWDIRDLSWLYGLETARTLPERLLARLTAWVMGTTLSKTDLVVTANPGIDAVVRAAVRNPDRVVLVANSVSSALVRALEREGAPTGAGTAPIAVYVGYIGRMQALDVVLDVAGLLPDIRFEFVGEGPERPRLERVVRARSLANVEFRGYVRPDDLGEVYRRASVLLAQLADNPSLCATGFPTKLFEYMAARRPIVYAGTGICADILGAAGAALVVPPHDAAAYARAVQSLVTEPAIGAKLVDAGVRYLDALGTREAAMDRLVDAVRCLVSAPVPGRHA